MSLNRKFLAAVAVMMLSTPALADNQTAAGPDKDCTLPLLASLPVTVLSNGELGVPVMLGGKQQILELDIGAPYSYLYASYIEAEGFNVKNMPRDIGVQVGGKRANEIAIVPELKIGGASGKNVQFAVIDDPARANGAAGELALNILSSFDVELDLANNRINLFSQKRCSGNVIYWSDSYATLPFVTDAAGHPSVKMLLDGKAITVAFAIMQRPAFMAMAAVKRLWGMDETAPGMTPIANPSGGAPVKYRYPFKQLAVEGVAIGNPQIDLLANATECRAPTSNAIPLSMGGRVCFGASDLELGLKELKQLHVYYAFKEKKIYLTAASAGTAKDTPGPTGAPAQLGKPK